MDGYLFFFLLVVAGIITANIYKAKGKSAWHGFLVGFFLGIIGIVVAVMMQKQESNLGKRKCPYCAEKIRPEAKVCRHCGRDIPPAFTIPTKYRLEHLPPLQAKTILQKSPEQNLKSAKHLIETKEHHQAIATLQAIVNNTSEDSKLYEEAYMLLYEIFK